MTKLNSRSILAASLVSGVSLLFTACGNTQTSSGQNATGVATSIASTQSSFSQSPCLTGKLNFTGTSAWYVSGTMDIINTCQSEQNLNTQTVSFTSQDASGAPIKFTTLNNWWINDTGYKVSFASGSANVQSGTFSADNGNPIIKPNQTIVFSGGINLNGSPFDSATSTKTFSLNGSTPNPLPLYGSLDVVVDTANANCTGTNNCANLNVNVTNATGASVANFTVPSTSIGAVYTKPLINLEAGGTYFVSSSSVTNATQAYTPSTSALIAANEKSVITVKYNKVEPVITTGKASITMPTVVPNFSGDLQVNLINTKAANKVVGTYTLKQGASITTPELLISDENNSYIAQVTTGIADPLAGLYYTQASAQSVDIQKGKTSTIAISLTPNAKALQSLTLNISGLASNDAANVSFSDAANKYRYVSYANQSNGSKVYKVEDGLNFGTLVKASSLAYETNPISSAAIISSNATINAAFKAQAVATGTYDYIAPFKDYNNKIALSVQGVASAKSVSFTSNFMQKDGWGSCFGQGVYNLDFATAKTGDKYTTTITPKLQTSSLDLTKSCDIMGTDSGNAVVLAGVVDPIVYSVKVDGKTLGIKQPCADNGCKDPGNGYVNAGYYAQWSVWGRQYNPYDMPFANINDIIYAFVGFNPADGSIKSLDTSADSWGMSAVSRAMLQYPYMNAHLSFGGWTNNGVNTAPMFEQLASSNASMTNFANQAIALMRKTGFNGIDIDWEWWSDYSNNAAPAKKMLAFYKVLRNALDEAGAADGKKYTLTIAVNGGSDRIAAMQSTSNPNSVPDFWAQVGAIMDHINVMNYDYHGSWDSGSPAYFQASYDFANTSPYRVGKEEGWSIKSSIGTYIANGVPAKKLVVGIPLYARTMGVASSANGGLFQNVTGAGFGDWENGVLDYKCVINPINNPKTGCGSDKPIASIKSLTFYNAASNASVYNQYGKDAMQPWAYSGAINSFMTYDDQASAVQKAKAVKASNLGGTMYWELDGDAVTPSQSIVQSVRDEYNR